MSAVLHSTIQGIENPKPGAVVYQPSDAAFKFDKSQEGLYTPVGMAVDDPIISKAFDGDKKGTFGVIKGQ
ncbi:MAG: hypothetical protein RR728_10380, partial [Oscillospiraceae bacterium]